MSLRNKALAVSLLTSCLVAAPSKAAVFTLPQIDTTMTDPICKTLASGMTFRPMEPASDLGKLWGFYVGTEVTGTNASSVSNIFAGSPSYFPSADLQFGLGLPMGLTFEAGLVPSVSYSGTSYAKYAGAVKWTITRSFLDKLPLDLAFQVLYTNGALNYTQALNGGSVTVDYKTNVMAANLLASKSFGFLITLEPYAGIGLANQSSTLNGSGTANLFGASFPAGTQSISTSGTSAWLEAGLLFKMGLLGVTGEYDNLFGLSSYNVKLSLRF